MALIYLRVLKRHSYIIMGGKKHFGVDELILKTLMDNKYII